MEQNLNIERRIKKHIFGKPQTVVLTSCPGFQEVTKSESMLYGQVNSEHLSTDRNRITVRELNFENMLKLLAFGKSFEDFWLEVVHVRWKNLETLATQLTNSHLDLIIPKDTKFTLKVEIIKSHFKDKDEIEKRFKSYASSQLNSSCVGERNEGSISIFISLFRDVLRIYVSLSGAPLFKRGYRRNESADAPLRETIASSALQSVAAKIPELELQSIDTLFVPFAGSGTFLFEFWLLLSKSKNFFDQRKHDIENLAFFPKARWAHLTKENSDATASFQLKSIYCDNSSKALQGFENNLAFFQTHNTLKPFTQELMVLNDDFLQMSFEKLNLSKSKHIFLPLNPPYGLRLQKSAIESFYRRIGETLNSLKAELKTTQMSGFVFCPTEETWKALLSSLKDFQFSTQHFMQGGLDIRIVYFNA